MTSEQNRDRARIRRRLSRAEWLLCTFFAVVIVAFLAPDWWPHWREGASESCHLCGNRRHTLREFRWYREARITRRFLTDYPVPDGHLHNWWRYDFVHSRGGAWMAMSRTTYKDGGDHLAGNWRELNK